MKKLAIDLAIDMDYIVFAYQDDSPDNAYYLDTEFGDIRLVNRNLSDLKDLTDEIELSHGRFLYIPKPDRAELVENLRTFWEIMDNQHLKNLLALAFETPSVSITFKDILNKYPPEKKKLEGYLKTKALDRVKLWLNANAIESVEREEIAH